ncbi:NrfD/PsrC family molybdoenzyme membrane anchor subunit [Arcobacter sp.]|uniref:NrfD/PsrC family molybdoenzyme membrane anchor subunit n=1 Tax=Arcobacter sp. TaxID=1872629 RepID=UPI003D0D3296
MNLLWDIRVVLDLFLGGIGISAFILASLLYIIDVQKYQIICKTGFIMAPIFVLVGLFFLLLEIGRPFYAITMLTTMNPTSILSWGGFLQGVFILISLFIVFQIIKGNRISNTILFITMILAFIIGIYHGALLSSFGRSVWNSSLPVLFLTTSLLVGFLTTMAISQLFKQEELNSKVINGSVITFLLLSFVSLIGWIYGLDSQDIVSKEALAYLMNEYFLLLIVAVAFGMLLPIIVYVKLLLTQKQLVKIELTLMTASSLIGVFVLKYVVVYLGQLEYLVK